MIIIVIALAFLFVLFAFQAHLFMATLLASFFLIGVAAYLFWGLRRQDTLSYLTIVLPILFQFSYYLFSSTLQQVYPTSIPIIILLSVLDVIILYLLFQSMKDIRGYHALPLHNSRVILNSITLLASYCFFVSVYFLELPAWSNLLIIFIFTFFIFLQSALWWSRKNIPSSIFFSLICAFIITELFWLIGLLPQDYLITALLVLNVQHVLMGILQSYFKKDLSEKVLLEYVVIPAIIMVFILLLSQWTPSYT